MPGEGLAWCKGPGVGRCLVLSEITAGVECERVHTQEVRLKAQQRLHLMANLNRMENRGHMAADQGWEL